MRMRNRALVWIGSLWLAVWISACAAGPEQILPTTVAPAEVPPVNTPIPDLPPTQDLSTRETRQPTPTRPTSTPRPTATPVTPIISITSPRSGADLLLGSDIQIRGLLERRPGQRVLVGLLSATGEQLAVSEAVVEDNAWRASLRVPESVTGIGRVEAAIFDGDEVVARASLAVNLVLDAEQTGTYLVLSRPGSGDIAVADHNLFFDGNLQRFGGGFLRISVWSDNCSIKAAEHGFSMRSSSYWQGFVVLPRDITPGPGCAVASVGMPGDEFYRAAQIPIMILAKDDPAATGVTIAGPRADQTVLSGETILIYGTAYNPPEGQVNLSVLLDNGRIITEGFIEADDWGYWEQSIVLPFDVEGQAAITASLGDPNDPLSSAEILVNIDPGPTPTVGLPATLVTTPTATPTVTQTP